MLINIIVISAILRSHSKLSSFFKSIKAFLSVIIFLIIIVILLTPISIVASQWAWVILTDHIKLVSASTSNTSIKVIILQISLIYFATCSSLESILQLVQIIGISCRYFLLSSHIVMGGMLRLFSWRSYRLYIWIVKLVLLLIDTIILNWKFSLRR